MRAPKRTVANAQRLRRNLSPPEARLWSRLRARLPSQPVFRRQHPIGPYVLDFYCAAAKLAVEVDGISHDMADRAARDEQRDAWLGEQRIRVVRIPATDLRNRFEEAVDAIVRMAAEQL